MSTLRTNNLQNPDSSSVNIELTQNGGAVFSGVTTFSSDLNIAGVLTYEDVTNIDSVGLITARSGLNVTGGLVGIGTDNPLQKLHIYADTGIETYGTQILLQQDGVGDVGIQFNLVGESNWTLGVDNSDNNKFKIESGNTIGGSNDFVIQSSGNIGIGTDNPAHLLHLEGSSPIIQFEDSDNAANIYSLINGGGSNGRLLFQIDPANQGSDSYVGFDIDGSEKLRITSGGQLRSQATYNGSASTSDTFPCLNLNNLQGSYTADNIIGGVTFGKLPGHGNGIRAGMLALYAGTGSLAGNIGANLVFRTSTESGGDSQERVRITDDGRLLVKTTENRGTTADIAGTLFLGETANNTAKRGYVYSSQYNSDSEPEGFTAFAAFSNTTSNNALSIGGGASAANAATSISFFTESNTTTRTGTQRMLIHSSGRVTMPYQPAFLAYSTNGQTTYGSGAEFILNSTQTNIGNHYSTTTGRFTAPVTGFYAFSYGIYSYAAGQGSFKLNGSDYIIGDAVGLYTTGAQEINGASIKLTLAANDTVSFGWRAGNSGQVYRAHGWFSGHLIG